MTRSTVLGIETIKIATRELAVLCSAVYGAAADRKVTLSDAIFLRPIGGAVYRLWSISAVELRAEIDDLDPTEKQELAACFRKEFALSDSMSAEHCVETGFEMLVDALPFLAKIIKFGERIDGAKRAGATAAATPIPVAQYQQVQAPAPQPVAQAVTHVIEPVVRA